MAALLGFLAVIGTVVTVLWRISLAFRMAKDVGQFAKKVINKPQKTEHSPKTGAADLQTVSDPREAAVVLMLVVARAGGKVSKRHKDAIINQITGRFLIPTIAAEQLLAHGFWLSKDLSDGMGEIDRMSEIIQQTVSPKELLELEGMLMQIAHVNGAPTSAQKQVVNQFAHRVGI